MNSYDDYNAALFKIDQVYIEKIEFIILNISNN